MPYALYIAITAKGNLCFFTKKDRRMFWPKIKHFVPKHNLITHLNAGL